MWDWLLIEDNRVVLSWLGGGVVVAVGGLWTVYIYFRKSAKSFSPTPTSITTGNIQSGGDTVVGPGTIDKRKYYGLNDVKLAKQLGVAEYAVTNFFKILDHQHIPIEEWDHALRQLADRYKELQQRAAQLESEDPNVQALQTQAKQAIDNVDFEQAEALLDKAIDLDNVAAEKFQASFIERKNSAAASQALKAESLHTRFALPQAIEAYKQSIVFAQKGEDEVKVAEYRWSLGRVYADNFDFDQALTIYEKALNHYLSLGGEGSSSVVQLWNNLGLAWGNKGQHDKAIEYFEKALAVDIDTYWEGHPHVAGDWNNLGAAWLSKGQYGKAIEYYEKALAVYISTFGEDHPNMAMYWNNLATALTEMGQYDKAIEYLERALAVDIDTFGEVNSYVAGDWNNLGLAWMYKGQQDKAIEYYEKALAVDIATNGEDTPNVAEDWNNLGAAWLNKGQYDKAIEYYEKALAVYIDTFGEDHPNVALVWYNMGAAWGNKGQYEKAIEYFEKALKVQNQFLGGQHPSTIRTINDLEIAEQKSMEN